MKGSKPSIWVERLEDIPDFAVYALTLTEKDETKQALENYLEDWRHVKPKATGHDLKEHGLPPGPEYQSILDQLRAAWLDGKINSKEEEYSLLEQLLSSSK
jgi:tRNA nucleotidyltransferase (CCA-adding enzyme)